MWTNEKKWPDSISRKCSIENFKKLYILYGYIETDNSSYEEDYDKIAFYIKNGYPSHASKQFGDMWKSKIGPNNILEHKLEWLCGDGDSYGEVCFYMKRLSV